MDKLAETVRAWGIPALEQEPLSLHTSFQIGGPARLFASPKNAEQLARLIRHCNEEKIRYFVLGKGSNLLADDRGFDGVIIEIGAGFNHLSCSGNTITCGAGVPLTKLALFAAAEGLAGLAFSYGIPGSVGGAVYMNAGAYGGEMKDVLASVTHLDEKGEIHTLQSGELDLGYRHSVYFDNRCIILEARLDMREGDPSAIRTEMEEFMSRRKASQPLEMPSAGSTFMRPPGKFAGPLIECCGLKGYQIGGAQVSEKHAGFVVNAGGATAKDVLALVEHIQKTVLEKTDVQLNCEIKVLRY